MISTLYLKKGICLDPTQDLRGIFLDISKAFDKVTQSAFI